MLGRVLAYGLAGGVAAATVGPYLVLVLLACGALELARHALVHRASLGVQGWPLPGAVLATAKPAGAGALAWTAFKVGALAFGGGLLALRRGVVPTLLCAGALGTAAVLAGAPAISAA